MNNKAMYALGLCLLFSGAAMAQESEGDGLKSYNFVEAQGGMQFTPTDAKNSKLITPIGALSFGRFFTPAVGARIHVNGWQAKSGFEFADGSSYYKWNYITTDIDVLLNLNRLISKKNHFLNVMLIGGIGLNTAWGNEEANALAASDLDLNMPLVWDGTRLSHNIRGGVRLETDVTKPVGVSLEVTANSLDDRFNSKYSNRDDWMITAMLGVSVRFGHKYKEKAPEPEPAPAPAPAPKPEPKTITRVDTIYKKVPVKLREERFYSIRESDPQAKNAQMTRVAEFLKNYPEATITITGYADKGTGNPTINMKYSQQRADMYKQDLINEYGCDGSRINTAAKGDTVQPFSENDKNRCVIIEGQAEKTEMETVTKTETVYE